MSLEAVIARVSELQELTTPRARSATPPSGTTETFAAQLGAAQGVPSQLYPGATGVGTAGLPFQQTVPGAMPGIGASSYPGVTQVMPGAGAPARIAAAAAEVGVTEQPPGSNDSPRIAQYRASTAGNPGAGPWCAYFVSWASQQSGTPLGDGGKGFASVDALYAWAQRTGKAIPNSAAAPVAPQPGDLIVWDEHVGLVESVDPDGTVHTIEGNSSNMVARRSHDRGSALGYVRPG